MVGQRDRPGPNLGGVIRSFPADPLRRWDLSVENPQILAKKSLCPREKNCPRRIFDLALLCEKSHVLDLPFLAGKSAALLAVEHDEILAVQDYF